MVAIAPAGFEQAYRTLIRGTELLSTSLRARACGARSGSDSLPDTGGARVVGNGLRELDRFLGLLLDEAMRGIAPATFDHAGYVRRTNVAAKLRDFHRLAGLSDPDEARLRAIGRVRACLHHCRGIIHDPELRGDLHIASATVEHAGSCGPRLQITFDDLARICNFYAASASLILTACNGNPRIP